LTNRDVEPKLSRKININVFLEGSWVCCRGKGKGKLPTEHSNGTAITQGRLDKRLKITYQTYFYCELKRLLVSNLRSLAAGRTNRSEMDKNGRVDELQQRKLTTLASIQPGKQKLKRDWNNFPAKKNQKAETCHPPRKTTRPTADMK